MSALGQDGPFRPGHPNVRLRQKRAFAAEQTQKVSFSEPQGPSVIVFPERGSMYTDE